MAPTATIVMVSVTVALPWMKASNERNGAEDEACGEIKSAIVARLKLANAINLRSTRQIQDHELRR